MRNLVRHSTVLLLATLSVGSAVAQEAAEAPVEVIDLPVLYEADRFVLAPVTAAGDTLRFYTDTGGGANMLYKGRLPGPAEEEARPIEIGGDTARVIDFPRLKHGAAVPPPTLLPPFGQGLLLFDAPPTAAAEHHGFLGRTWFAGRIWDFNYPARSLGYVVALDADAAATEHQLRLGFQVDSAGRRTTHFPRIRVEIDGDSLDLLFDTGAMIVLTDEALARMADGGPAARGGSFVSETIFERWRERHPDWRVLEAADQLGEMPIIEVPEVHIAGYRAGPVWFAMRPDANFSEFMSQWMDRPVVGALGGSALRYFRVIVDYPNARAFFFR